MNMSFTPYMDGWGDLTGGSAGGLGMGMQIDTAWSTKDPNGLFILAFDYFTSGAYYKNAVIWPNLSSPTSAIFIFPVNPDTGKVVVETAIPAGVSGVRIYLQELWQNKDAAYNMAATNCLCLTVP